MEEMLQEKESLLEKQKEGKKKMRQYWESSSS